MSDWEAARRIVCVRLDNLGDVLMSSPAIRALKRARPGRRVTLLASPSGAAAASCLPEIDETIVHRASWVKGDPADPDETLIERLRLGGYDAAVVFTAYTQSPLPAALACRIAGIPRRAAHCRENPYGLLTDWILDPEPAVLRHEVRRQLALAAALGAPCEDERMRLTVPSRAKDRAASLLRAAGVDLERPWALIHPGASASSRRYPAESFAAAAASLVREHGVPVAFTGDAGERELVETIRASMGGAPSASLAGLLGFEELCAAISLAPVLVSNNTGPAHVAAAVGTAVVDLYALTNPQHAPWRVPARVLYHDVPCKWCCKSVCPEGHQDCLRLVPPAAVVEAARALLALSRT